ncbi:hypothetical protein ATANTOWER_032751 [Ataeniobius toweri]|uniref:Uncharacterized protein n=1 Tax=Ataeniobius toweri TaxID=208326 RepID=A0ABU7CAT6_9TELE|nr:hypothetical protein [Ataeniobius toweri]
MKPYLKQRESVLTVRGTESAHPAGSVMTDTALLRVMLESISNNHNNKQITVSQVTVTRSKAITCSLGSLLLCGCCQEFGLQWCEQVSTGKQSRVVPLHILKYLKYLSTHKQEAAETAWGNIQSIHYYYSTVL